MCTKIPGGNQTKILPNIQVKLKVPATTNNKVKYGKHQISFNRLLVYFQRLRFSILVYVVRSSWGRERQHDGLPSPPLSYSSLYQKRSTQGERALCYILSLLGLRVVWHISWYLNFQVENRKYDWFPASKHRENQENIYCCYQSLLSL